MRDNIISENNPDIESDYLEQMKHKASLIDFENKKYFRKLHIVNLKLYTPEEYYNTLKDWHDIKPFVEPKKKYADQQAGISFGLRIKAFFIGAVKSELEERKNRADVMYEADKKAALEYYNKRAARFYEKREQQHDNINKQHEMMRRGNIDQIVDYFSFVLRQDDYSTDCMNQFFVEVTDVRYEQKSKKLCFAYRIPNKEEILTFSCFQYDSSSDSIQPKSIEAKYQVVQRKRIMRCILLRSLMMVYGSDAYGFVDDVEVTGFLRYYDESYGTDKRKDVVNFHMSRAEYVQTDFERVNVEALFSTRLQVKESIGLYAKKEEEISDIYTTKEKTNSNTKK